MKDNIPLEKYYGLCIAEERRKNLEKYEKIFDIDEKIISRTTWFDEEVLGNMMTDFFASRPTEYSKSNKSFSEADLF